MVSSPPANKTDLPVSEREVPRDDRSLSLHSKRHLGATSQGSHTARKPWPEGHKPRAISRGPQPESGSHQRSTGREAHSEGQAREAQAEGHREGPRQKCTGSGAQPEGHRHLKTARRCMLHARGASDTPKAAHGYIHCVTHEALVPGSRGSAKTTRTQARAGQSCWEAPLARHKRQASCASQDDCLL